jgi:hypothetical protein
VEREKATATTTKRNAKNDGAKSWPLADAGELLAVCGQEGM